MLSTKRRPFQSGPNARCIGCGIPDVWARMFFTIYNRQETQRQRIHDDVIKWKHFPRYWLWVGNSPVPGEFSAQRPVTRSFDVFFDLRLNKRLSKQSWGWWFETQSDSLWRHCNDMRGLVCVVMWWTLDIDITDFFLLIQVTECSCYSLFENLANHYVFISIKNIHICFLCYEA